MELRKKQLLLQQNGQTDEPGRVVRSKLLFSTPPSLCLLKSTRPGTTTLLLISLCLSHFFATGPRWVAAHIVLILLCQHWISVCHLTWGDRYTWATTGTTSTWLNLHSNKESSTGELLEALLACQAGAVLSNSPVIPIQKKHHNNPKLPNFQAECQ